MTTVVLTPRDLAKLAKAKHLGEMAALKEQSQRADVAALRAAQSRRLVTNQTKRST